MSHEQTLRDYYQAWSTGDPEAVLPFFTGDAVFEDLAFGAKFEGLEAIKSFVVLTYQGAPDFKVTPTKIVVEGDSAAAEWTMSGTHAGDLPGLPKTGKPFEVRAVSVVEFDGDKIQKIVDYWNPVAFQQSVALA